MILEVADIAIDPTKSAEFEAALAQGLSTLITQAKGYVGHLVQKGIEQPGRYLLLIDWQTLDDHMVGFRQSEAFVQWRALVGPFFLRPPQVEHFETRLSR